MLKQERIKVQNSQTTQRFHNELRQHQKRLEQSLLSAVTQGREAAADNSQDVTDQAVQSYQKEMLFSQGTSGHEQLTLVRQALQRLHEGTFGECVLCSTAIGQKRLEALPWTPYCIACQEKIESGEIEDPVRAA
jgi:DnaK suppressor protein